QHVTDPAKVVSEMARVVRSGGRIAILEPDWDTIVVAGGDLGVSRALRRYQCDVAIAHGTVRRELRRLLVEAGCIDARAGQGSLTFGSFELAGRVMSVRLSLDGAVTQGWLGRAEAEAWWATQQALDREGKFLAAMSGVAASATVA